MNKLLFFLFITIAMNGSQQINALLIDNNIINEIIAISAVITQGALVNGNQPTTSQEDTTINYESLSGASPQKEK